MGNNREDNRDLSKYLPSEVIDFLYDGQFFSINDTIYRGMVFIDSKTDEKYVDFIETTKAYVNTICFEPGKDGKKNIAASSVIRDHELNMMNYFPCNIKDEYRHIYKNLVWNKYHAPVHNIAEVSTEKDVEEKCYNTLNLFRHSYQEKIELALDYATVELMLPKQPLPVQVLFSLENNTGKSTVLLHRRAIYGKNASVMSVENFEDKFNSTVVGKNCVLIDEGELKKPEALIKLKMLVTSPVIMNREMFRSAVEVPNFGKYYFTTNKEFFAKLDTEDSRFWVSLVPKLEKDKYDPDFQDKIEAEVPYWLGFLKKRWELRGLSSAKGLFKMQTSKKLSRLWFLEEDYITEALLNLKRKSIDIPSKDFLIDILDWFDGYNGDHPNSQIKGLYCNAKAIKDNFFKNNAKVGSDAIKRILEKDLKLKMLVNSKGESKSVRYIDYFGRPYATPVREVGGTLNGKNVYYIEYSYLHQILNGKGVDTEEVLDVTPGAVLKRRNGVQTEIKHKQTKGKLCVQSK